MKIVVDMNLGLDWVALLRDRGLGATHWSRIGEESAKDEDIMEHCSKTGAIVLTADHDFARMHALYGSRRPSIVQLRSDDVRPEFIGIQVVRAINATRKALADGAVLIVTPKLTRLRRLPIGSAE